MTMFECILEKKTSYKEKIIYFLFNDSSPEEIEDTIWWCFIIDVYLLIHIYVCFLYSK